MTAAATQAIRMRSAPDRRGPDWHPDWRKAGMAAAAVGLNAGLIALLSLDSIAVAPLPRSATRPMIYLDIEPRPRIQGERARRAAPVLRDTTPVRPDTPRLRAPSSPLDVSTPPNAPAPTVPDAWRMQPVDPADRPALPGLAGCGAPDRLSQDARDLCHGRRMRLAERAGQVVGTGDADRDAAFARQGARRLAAWEAQRARPAPGDPPCETPHPVAGCEGVNVQVELFSSRDGLLPNLRKRRE